MVVVVLLPLSTCGLELDLVVVVLVVVVVVLVPLNPPAFFWAISLLYSLGCGCSVVLPALP